ncbi:MAG: tRNA (adenosine(37)-N6)-threonylcarbamoyltransferase complex transferase subunit TsaD [Alphaproteobacteria bacterium]|nr:tRNA (adenosine(37)-N6)-threonylcarbamoyltransferase complex transferase subunit TsaD [Alphaproteobacteria bacterium]
MRVLGIETSCDETAAAVVERDGNGVGYIVSNVVRSQHTEHAGFGGVVPEIAARAHVVWLDGIIGKALAEANCTLNDLDAIAATAGPGLIGGLLVGLTSAKALASVTGKPFLAINHLEAHVLTARLTNNITFPYLVLLVSGGHTQIVLARAVGRYERWGTTLDDALGEAFDKVAKLLSLGFPGGPAVEVAARDGNATRFAFPRPLLAKKNLDFSFSGLKTAVRIAAERAQPLSAADICDICASFQAAVVEVLARRSAAALARYADRFAGRPPVLVVAGGVAANLEIRKTLETVCKKAGATLVAPPGPLCSDNGAMIGWAGAERLALGDRSDFGFAVRPRWPLDDPAMEI